MEEKVSSSNDLFDNPMIRSAMKALSPEQLEEYKRIGEYMYKTNNFTKENPTNIDPEEEIRNILFYTTEDLKAGLHPQDLTPKELQILYDVVGETWYEQYGYTKEEVPQIPGFSIHNGKIQETKTKRHKKPKKTFKKR
jgi:hypothetical protein